ncbi:PqqD family peptide modification chaperone [Pseudomaricurvus alkylphenolicus]|uniref:PqqD family peptide modification chaperone n=1 Tax=Pseudomaricurvus alkylphenolicus TaxID=1306991 RepID=UPI001421DE8B|nr:PqqD family peptide modification chaperone [Pseudomaricurvus alkylphenolicus]NIB40156.1 PqqD family peptide modification chaperone [Pseudomaricurvus alkylphenolicus]
MQPAEGTRLFFLDNQGVLFDEQAQKLFHLNTTATYIWCLLEEGKNEAEIEQSLQATFNVTEFTAQEYCLQTREFLQSLGVLKGYEVKRQEPHEELPGVAATYSDSIFVAERHYGLLSSCFRVRFNNEKQLALVHPVLEHLTTQAATEPTATLDVVTTEGEGLSLFKDRRQVNQCASLQELAPVVKSQVWQTAVIQHGFFLDIHAGVVGDGERCYLLPAAPGSGKSTLTTALTRNGFEYFSDEVALLQLPGMMVQPVPLATCVKDTGVEVLSSLCPHLPGLTMHNRGDGKRVRYLRPPSGSIPSADTLRPVGALVFPQYTPGGPSTLKPLSALDTLQMLMAECLIVDTILNAEKVAALLSWIERTPSYRLEVDSLNQAVELMRHLSRELAHKPS